jgi:hypothetical protein
LGVAYVRTVKTSSGASAVQIVYSYHRGSREIEHIGSAHDEVQLELLKAVAQQRLHAGQLSLDFGDGQPGATELPILSTRSKRLWEALSTAYQVLGFDLACERDEVFQGLVLARIIEPTSKLESIRVLEEVGVPAGRIRRSTAGWPGTPPKRGGTGSPARAPRMPGWARRRWCCTT